MTDRPPNYGLSNISRISGGFEKLKVSNQAFSDRVEAALNEHVQDADVSTNSRVSNFFLEAILAGRITQDFDNETETPIGHQINLPTTAEYDQFLPNSTELWDIRQDIISEVQENNNDLLQRVISSPVAIGDLAVQEHGLLETCREFTNGVGEIVRGMLTGVSVVGLFAEEVQVYFLC